MIQIENIGYPMLITDPKPIKIDDSTSPEVSKENVLKQRHVTKVMSK